MHQCKCKSLHMKSVISTHEDQELMKAKAGTLKLYGILV